LPYRRRLGESWSAVDALQWTFTMSASSKLVDSSDKLHVRALVGPMDIATVTWHRRLVRCANDDVDTSDSDGSLVLQGIVSTVNDDDDLIVLQTVCDLLNHISYTYMFCTVFRSDCNLFCRHRRLLCHVRRKVVWRPLPVQHKHVRH
jgi:hypothetical protein